MMIVTIEFEFDDQTPQQAAEAAVNIIRNSEIPIIFVAVDGELIEVKR